MVPPPQHSLQLMQPIPMPASQAHRYHHSTSHPIYQPRPTHPPPAPAAMTATPLASSSGHVVTALHQQHQQPTTSSASGLQPHQHQQQQQVQLAVIGGRYRPLTTLCLGGELVSVPQVLTQDVSSGDGWVKEGVTYEM